MSKVPVTPPEISSREDTPPDSLLARLRKITGLTEAELPSPPPAEPAHPGPPVDRLMVALREATGVAAACSIAIAVSLAALSIWIAGRIRAAGQSAGGHWERRLAAYRVARKASQQPPPQPSQPEPAKAETGAEHAAESLFQTPVGLPVEEVAAPRVEEAQVDAGEVITPMEEYVPAKPSPAPLPRRRFRRALTASLTLACALPALLLIPAIRYKITSLLGRGNAAVVVGENGWLFPRHSFEGAAGLHETAARLRAGGATLIVVNVPAKAAVYPEWLHASHDGGLERDPAVIATRRKLTEAGALLLDLGPVLHALKTGSPDSEEVFRAQSSHWSPRGVERAAAAAASFLQQQPGYPSLTLHPLQPVLARGTMPAPLEDLAAAFDSRRWRDEHPPQALHFIRLLGPDNKPLPQDSASSVVLIGGDEVRIYDDPAVTPPPENVPAGERLSAGLAQYLAMYLSTPLDVQTADNSIAAANAWLDTRPESDRNAKKFILWVVPDAEMAP